jgi:Na+-driven multidrug efflux pump
MAGKSIFLSLTRQVLYLIPLTLVMPMVFAEPLNGVWWSIPISDTLSAITAAVMLWIQISKFKKMIEEQEAWISSTPPEPD